jgi:hypothetical protein
MAPVRVPATQPVGPLQVCVEFPSGPLAGMLRGGRTVQVVDNNK